MPRYNVTAGITQRSESHHSTADPSRRCFQNPGGHRFDRELVGSQFRAASLNKRFSLFFYTLQGQGTIQASYFDGVSCARRLTFGLRLNARTTAGKPQRRISEAASKLPPNRTNVPASDP